MTLYDAEIFICGFRKKHKAYISKYKALILKYKAHILKYMPYVFFHILYVFAVTAEIRNFATI